MQVIQAPAVLDREQLRDITMDDGDLMKEIVAALVDDTERQIGPMQTAIRERDATRCKRLAHYSKGACANVGAKAAAATLQELERHAAVNEFEGCSRSLAVLIEQLDRLRHEADSL